jgi:hypothetical protein
MPGAVPSVTPAQADRFARAFAAFVQEARNAVADAARDPTLASTPQFEAWRGRALPLLEQENGSVQQAVAALQSGDARPILVQAEDKRGLAKDMDGFPLTFAGPDHAQLLGNLRTSVVRTAFQLCEAAGVP